MTPLKSGETLAGTSSGCQAAMRIAVKPRWCDRQGMLPNWPHQMSARLCHARSLRGTLAAAALCLGAAPALAFAQDAEPDVAGPSDSAPREVAFEADGVSYDSEADTVTASGDVVMKSEGQTLNADSVSWNRVTGQIVANGNIRLTDEDGNHLYAESIELTDALKAGAMENLLLVLAEGGRIVAISMQGPVGRCVLGVKVGGAVGVRPVFDAAAPVLPGLGRAKGFEF